MNPPTSPSPGGSSSQTTIVLGGAGVPFHTHPTSAITGDLEVLVPDRLADVTVEIQDFNAVLETGCWAADTGAANAPDSSFWTLRVERYGIDTTTGNFARQTAQEVVPPYRTFQRNVNVVTWTSWVEIDQPAFSEQAVQSANVTPNGTANSTLTDLSVAVTSPGTSAVYMVEIDADVTFTGAQTNIIELLVDGVAETAQLYTAAAATGYQVAGHKKWRITGLAAGSVTFTARTRNTAAGTAATVNMTHTLMTVQRVS